MCAGRSSRMPVVSDRAQGSPASRECLPPCTGVSHPCWLSVTCRGHARRPGQADAGQVEPAERLEVVGQAGRVNGPSSAVHKTVPCAASAAAAPADATGSLPRADADLRRGSAVLPGTGVPAAGGHRPGADPAHRRRTRRRVPAPRPPHSRGVRARPTRRHPPRLPPRPRTRLGTAGYAIITGGGPGIM